MVRPQEMDEILRQIGWADGFNIPAISDENRELELEVSTMLREKASLLASVAELDELLAQINSHTNTLKAECSQNECLLTTQQCQLDSEENLIKLLQGEAARLKNAIQLERQDRRCIDERCVRIEAQLRGAEAGTRGAENDAASGQIVRHEWEKHEAQANKAAKKLSEFYKQDEIKLKDLELQRARLQEDVTTRVKVLHEASSAVGALEQQLDAAARQYRAGFAERIDLVKRWEASAAGVRAREQASQQLMQETAQLRASLQLKHEQLNEVRDFEENEARNNRELEGRIRSLGQQVSRQRSLLKSQQQLKAALHSEVGTLQCQLAGCGSELSETRARGTEANTLINEREALKQQLIQACDQRRSRLVSLSALQGGTGDRFNRLSTMLHEKERALAALHKRAERLELQAVRANQETARLKQAEETAAANVNAQKASLRQLIAQRDTAERELERHRDMLLCLELSVQRQQIRVQRLSSEKAQKFEDPKLEEREKILKTTLNNKRATQNLLSKELRNIEKSEYQMSQACLSARTELQENRDVERALQAAVDGGVHRSDEVDAHVSNNRARLALLKARVAKRHDDVSEERAAVLKLRTESLQAEHASKLQSSELGVETKSLSAEISGAQQENAELRSAIAQRKLRLQQLQNVYDITVKTMESDDQGEMGVNLINSATDYITRQRIRVAQEKGELVQRGNTLDEEIRRSEREIRAIEHMLAMIKSANDCYRSNLALPGAISHAEDPEIEARIAEEEQRQKEMQAELQKIRDTEERMMETVRKLRDDLATATEHHQTLNVNYMEREHEIAEMDGELTDQDIKLKRANVQARRISRELRSGNPGQPTFEERDLEVREMKRVTGSALRELWALGEDNVGVRPLVSRYLQEKGLPHVPSAPSPSQRLSAPRTHSRHSMTGATSERAVSERASSSSPSLQNIKFPETKSRADSQASQHSGKKS